MHGVESFFLEMSLTSDRMLCHSALNSVPTEESVPLYRLCAM